jgi:hypothetical protein
MAGGRIRTVRLVNRSTLPLDCMFDGVPDVVPPGYRAQPKLDDKGEIVKKNGKTVVETVGTGHDGEPGFHVVEYAAAEAYIRQHPIMGTSDPSSIDAKDTDYLIGCIEWGDEISHTEQSDAVELLNRALLPDDRQGISLINIAGGRREVASASVIHDRKVRANKRKAMMGIPTLLSADNQTPFGGIKA